MNTNVALLLGLLAGSLGGTAALQTFLGRTGVSAAHGVHPSTRTANHRGAHLPVHGAGGSTTSGSAELRAKVPGRIILSHIAIRFPHDTVRPSRFPRMAQGPARGR